MAMPPALAKALAAKKGKGKEMAPAKEKKLTGKAAKKAKRS